MSSLEKDSLDLMNVDYNDILHLYRGWRKSESILKDKDRELAELRLRVKSLQDSHAKFSNQIQGLESVKVLTMELQKQVSNLEQVNKNLVSENEELARLNMNGEEIIKKYEEKEAKNLKTIKNIQYELANLKGKYEENLKIQNQLEASNKQEQASKQAIELKLAQRDDLIKQLKEENQSLTNKLNQQQLKLDQYDHELLHASEQLSSLSKEIVNISNLRKNLNHSEVELNIIKGDISRLLRIIEKFSLTSGGKEFIGHWVDSGGMCFMGLPSSSGTPGTGVPSSSSYLDSEFAEENGYINENGEYIGNPVLDHTGPITGSNSEDPAESMKAYELSYNEFLHLKRIHGGDPYPIPNTLSEEAEYWVPKDAAKLGITFMQSRFPHVSNKVIMDFLRGMNKIWLRRERRKVKRVKEVLGATIDDLKRQIANMKPYQGVIAERQIRRLKNQVKQERSKTLSGRPKGKLEQTSFDKNNFYQDDFFDLIHSNSHEANDGGYSYCPTCKKNERRLCQRINKENYYKDTSIARVSSEKFLEASLVNLDTMSRRINQNAIISSSGNFDEDLEGTDTNDPNFPSASYLRGSLWLGRNLVMVMEELYENIENYRIKVLNELKNITKNSIPSGSTSSTASFSSSGDLLEYKRAGHRLTLLLTTCINHITMSTNQSRNQTREILQGLTKIRPGDSISFNKFLRTLPIESALSLRTVFTGNQQSSSSNVASFSPNAYNIKGEDEFSTNYDDSDSMAAKTKSIRFSSLIDSNSSLLNSEI